ncbi:MAG: hypothetical protein IVW54_16625 [Candidatus Binataceae bacterium]|nr:hypothetical protein [Candidatus Binataceae bacterium]
MSKQRARATRYRGFREPEGCRVERSEPTAIAGRRARWSKLSPVASLKVRNHSPTGFEWGYLGSGPAQLALALLLDFTGDRRLSERMYQDFKCRVVARWSNDDVDGQQWELTGQEILDAVKAAKLEVTSVVD